MAKAKFDPGKAKTLKRKPGLWCELPYFAEFAKHYIKNRDWENISDGTWYESATQDGAFEGMERPPSHKTFRDWLLKLRRQRGTNGKV